MSNIRNLDFYGFKAKIHLPEKLSLLENEFVLFDTKNDLTDEHLNIFIKQEIPTFSKDAFLKPSYYTPRNICYITPNKKLIYYNGNALVVQHSSTSPIQVDIICTNVPLLESILYLTLMFYSGEHFDKLGLFRLHAVGFEYKNKGIVVLLPIGGGKSTLLLNLLNHYDIKLISDDSPLINSKGEIYPYLVKIGISSGEVPSFIPKDRVSTFKHLEGTEKEMVDIKLFEKKISTQSIPVDSIFIGERFLGAGTEIVPLSYFNSWMALFKNCVIGLGIYQGLEYVINARLTELFGRVFLGARRMRTISHFIRKAKTYEFRMGLNPEQNAAFLINFLDTR